MPQFENGKIYKLWSPHGEDIYIGSTTLSLSMRKVGHKSNFNKDGGCSSKILFEKYDDVRIELIEEFPCQSRIQLNKREGYYIRSMDCVNKVIPDRTKKEYNEEHKEQKKQYDKHYREDNKEKINQKFREFYENNKDKIKESHKKYREANREEIIQKQRERRANNKLHNKYIMTQDFEVIPELDLA